MIQQHVVVYLEHTCIMIVETGASEEKLHILMPPLLYGNSCSQHLRIRPLSHQGFSRQVVKLTHSKPECGARWQILELLMADHSMDGILAIAPELVFKEVLVEVSVVHLVS